MIRASSVEDGLVWLICCVTNAHLVETDLPVEGGGDRWEQSSSLDRIILDFNTNLKVLPPEKSQAAHCLLADYILNSGENIQKSEAGLQLWRGELGPAFSPPIM